MKKNRTNLRKYDGYVSLTAVLIFSVIAISITTTLLLLITTLAITTESSEDYARAKSSAESCVEIVLNKLQSDVDYPAGETLVEGSAECEVVDILGTGSTNRTIQVKATADDITVRLEVRILTIFPYIEIQDWQEVSYFQTSLHET